MKNKDPLNKIVNKLYRKLRRKANKLLSKGQVGVFEVIKKFRDPIYFEPAVCDITYSMPDRSAAIKDLISDDLENLFQETKDFHKIFKKALQRYNSELAALNRDYRVEASCSEKTISNWESLSGFLHGVDLRIDYGIVVKFIDTNKGKSKSSTDLPIES